MAFVNLLSVIYPVGSVYLSINSTSPASIIGGTWKQIRDNMLRITTSAADTTGGSNSHTHSLSKNGYALIDVLAGAGESQWINIGSVTSNVAFTATAAKHAFQTLAHATTSETGWHGTALSGKTDSSATLPSYYTVHCWVRTA